MAPLGLQTTVSAMQLLMLVTIALATVVVLVEPVVAAFMICTPFAVMPATDVLVAPEGAATVMVMELVSLTVMVAVAASGGERGIR